VNKKSLFISAGIIFSLLMLSGCGYHPAKFANPLLENVSSIAVPYFKNKTFEPELEAIFSNAFANEFTESRRLRVVSRHEADVVLCGTVKKLVDDTIAYSRDDKALEYRVYVELDISLEDRLSGRVLWKRKNLKHNEEFPVGSSIVISETTKRAALIKLAEDIAERVHDNIMQGF
jgi:hypothetical protein